MGLEDFREYCARHQVLCPGRELPEDEARHQDMLDRIYRSPSIVRLGEPEAKFMEVQLRIDGYRYSLGAIDLVFLMPSKDVYLIEVKSSTAQTKTATKQLRRYCGFVWERFGVLAKRAKAIKRKSRSGFSVHVRQPDAFELDIFRRTQTLNDR